MDKVITVKKKRYTTYTFNQPNPSQAFNPPPNPFSHSTGKVLDDGVICARGHKTEIKIGGSHSCNSCGNPHFDTSKGFRRCFTCDYDLCNKCSMAMLSQFNANKNSDPYDDVTMNALITMAEEE